MKILVYKQIEDLNIPIHRLIVPLYLGSDTKKVIKIVELLVDRGEIYINYNPTKEQMVLTPFICFQGNTNYFDGKRWHTKDMEVLSVHLSKYNENPDIKSLKEQSI